MRNVFVSLASLVALTAVACSFQAGVGSEPHHPGGPRPVPTPTPAPAAPGSPSAAAQAAHPGGIGKHPTTPTPVTPVTPTPVTPPGAAVVSSPTIFGGPTPDPAGFKGTLYFIPAGTTAIPALASQTPSGYLFASSLNIGSQAFTSGFPGVDATHTTNFAIRYESPLVVDAESDYTFRLSSDDGSILSIDGTQIVNNDGAHALADKTGPVHLVAGTHAMTVDYMQTTGNVALQVFCKKGADAERICPTHL